MSHEKFKYKPQSKQKNKEKKAKSANYDAFRDQKKKKNREKRREEAKRREQASSGYSAQRSQLQFIFDNFGYIIPSIVIGILMLRFLAAGASAHKIQATGESKNGHSNVEPQGNSYKFPVSSSSAQSFSENPANQFAAAQGAYASQSTHEKTSAESPRGKSSQKSFTKRSSVLTDEEASELFKQLIEKLDGESAYTLFEKIKSEYLDHVVLQRRTKESLSFLIWKAISPEWNWSAERLTALIDAGADVNANAAEVLKYLGASVKDKESIKLGDDFPILSAIKQRNLEALKVLLKKGANPNVKTENKVTLRNYSPVHYVINIDNFERREEFLKILVEEGKANVNMVDADSYTPLYYVVTRSFNPNIVEILLKGGADLHLTPKRKGYDIEILHDMYKIWDFVKPGLSEKEKSYSHENFIKIMQLFKKHCNYDMNKLGSEGNNIIYTFAKRRHQVDSKTLKMHFRAQIALGANPYLKNALGESAADLNTAVLAEVLQEPEMKKILDKNGYTPKDAQEIKREFSRLITLSDGRAAYQQFQNIKKNYLRPEILHFYKKELSHAYLYAGMVTRWNWKLSEIEELLTLGANVDASPIDFVESREEKQEIISKANDTPLFSAIQVGDVARVKFLVDHGANVNRRLQDKMRFRQATPLLFLQGASNLKNKNEINNILLKAGANPNMRDSGGNTPLYLAARFFEVDLIESLLKGGARPNVKWNNDGVVYDVLFYMYAQKIHVDKGGQYAYAEFYSDDKFIKIVELCVKYGYQFNAKMGQDGGVLLHRVLRIASGFSDSFLEKTFRALIMQGANPYATDFSGMRPVDIGNSVFAKILDEPEVRDILKKNKFIDNRKTIKKGEVGNEEQAKFLMSTLHVEVPGETAYIQFTMLKKNLLERAALTPEIKDKLSQYLVNAILEWNWTIEQIEDLILLGADVNADLMLIYKDSPNFKNIFQKEMLYKPIFVALNKQKFKVVELLIKYGAFANDLIQDKVWKNASPLIQVIDGIDYKNKNETVELLLDQHVDTAVVSREGLPPLFAALTAFDCDAVKSLLENGADINARVRVKGLGDRIGIVHFFYTRLVRAELETNSKKTLPSEKEIKKILNVFKSHGVDLNQKDQLHGGVVESLLMQSHIPAEVIDKYLKISIEVGINPHQRSGPLKVLSSQKHYPLLTKAMNAPKWKLILEENGFYPENEIQSDDHNNAPFVQTVAQTPPDSGATLSKFWGIATAVVLIAVMFFVDKMRRPIPRPFQRVIRQPLLEGADKKEEKKEDKKDSSKKEKSFSDEEVAQEKKSLEDRLKKLKTTVENKTKDVESKILEYLNSRKVIHTLEKMQTRQDNINKLYVNIDKIIELSLAASYLSILSIDKSAEFSKIKGKLASLKSTLLSLQKSPEKLSQQLEEEFKSVKDKNILLRKKQKVNNAIQAVEEEMGELGQQFLEIKKKWENDIEEYETWISNVSKSQASSSASFAPKSPKFFPPAAVSAKVKFNDLQDFAKGPVPVTTSSVWYGNETTSSSSSTTESLNDQDELMLLSVEPASQEKIADFKKVMAAYRRFKEHYAKPEKADKNELGKKTWRLSVAYDIAMIVNALLEMYIKENNVKNEDIRGKFSMLRGKLVRYVFDLSDRYFEDAESLIVKYLGPISQLFEEKKVLDDNKLREFADIFQVSDMYLEASVINLDQKKSAKIIPQNIEKMKNALKDIRDILSPRLPLNSEKLKAHSGQYDAVKMLMIYLDFLYHPIDKKHQAKIPDNIQAYFSVKENNHYFACGLHKMRSEHLAHNMEINDPALDQYVITLSSKLNNIISEFDAWQQALASEVVSTSVSSSSSVSRDGGHVAHGSYWRPKQTSTQENASEEEKKEPIVDKKMRKKK